MKKVVLMFFALINACSFAQQHVSWKTHIFGLFCCNEATWAIQIFPGKDGKFYMLGQSQSYFPMFSSDNGKTWKYVKHPPFPEAYSLLTYYQCPNQKLIAATQSFNPDRYSAWLSDSSNDTSKSWIEVSSGLPVDSPLAKFAADSSSNIFASTRASDYYGTSSSKVYYLASGDTNWVFKSNGLPDSILINSLVMRGYNTIYAGTSDKGLFRSADRGNDWNKVSSLPGNKIQTVIINSKGDIFTANEFGVFISKDNGEKWDSLNTGLPAKGIKSFAFNKANTLFALAGDAQIYYLTEFSNKWTILTDSLKMEHFNTYPAIAINSNDYIFVIDANLGYYSVDPVTGIYDEKNDFVEIPKEYRLEQNYPNPFNPTTIINYSIPKQSYVELKVFDLLGREVAALVSEQKTKGEYKVQFNGSNLPSGVYIYNIQAGEFRDSKKLLLLR